MNTKYLANPRNFDSLLAAFEKMTGRKASKSEIAAARAEFDKNLHLTKPPALKR